MKQISYTSDETFYVADRSIDAVRERLEHFGSKIGWATPLEAWSDLGYWDRVENYEDFEVFEFRVTEKITKVEPPYSF
ncbi:hypothetical protein OG306_33270 [Streptomyces sp. NBC_01241]|uniref:hypothetical protein n=1 Tax=Streptomyces sp. NBC_01241 TaxID=2903794 RepID=UPI00352D8075|nr:hypothetical protein OG306_33270 [Streptomyces sp. NBC_01241]